ncbi:MAG: N(4)-(beta-N-acetylglucosaminyl)-L-asparaginase [Cyclobacteriaceae bacterium]|nr:N(4)-(beta-N-acetylglucosaminyl)-L-asparaginase [Cyclobacteriaceae bacterium]
MTTRRNFIKLSAIGSVFSFNSFSVFNKKPAIKTSKKPVVISTWNHGIMANKKAWKILSTGGKALDAVEKGVMEVENDPTGSSVGIGGRPDRDGRVTLDACIMDEKSRCGAVAFLQDIKNPIAVARKVMDETPHVMLTGQGAKQFALEKGFKEENLLTPESEKAWKEWLKLSKYKPVINVENHDTIGMLALDSNGDLSGSCTTSGAAFKLHGRVGDSPIIGAGLFVDNEIGAACATGLGEAVIRVAGSHLVVELMRQGHEPEEACKLAVDRIIAKHENMEGLQVGFLALRKDGKYGAYSVYKGFNYALTNDDNQEVMIDVKYDRS